MATQEEIIALIKARYEAAGEVEKAKRDLGGLKGHLLDVGKTAAGFLGAQVIVQGFTFARGQIGSMISGASDLAESMSKAQVVFGSDAAKIIEWSGRAATSFGQSKQQALEMAGTFGNLFTALGLTQSESAKMSTEVVQLASDIASFNNLPVDVALEKLRSGLVGEVEPLRTVGVNLSAAAVEAYILKNGLAASKDEITDSMKVQARYALILEQTKNAQGDFARTSNGLANQQRILKAQWADAKASLGEVMLPVVLLLVRGLTTYLIPAMTAGINAIRNFSDLIKAAMAGDLAGMAKSFAALPPPLQQLALWLQANRPLIEAIIAKARELAQDVLKAWIAIFKDVAKVMMEHKEVLIIVGIAIAALLIWMYAIPIAILAVIIAIGLLRAHWEEIWGAMPGPVKAALELIWAYVQYVFESIRIYVTFIMETIRNIVVFIMAILRGDWGAAWQAIKDEAAAVWQLIHDDIANKLGFIRDAISIFGPYVQNLLYAVWHAIENEASRAWTGVKNAIIGPIQTIIDKIKELIDWINKIPSPGDIAGGIGGAIGSAIPFHASGVRNFAGGWAVVGEQGAELVHLPRGSSVFSHGESQAILRGSSGPPGQTRVYINQLVVENGDVSSILAAVRR